MGEGEENIREGEGGDRGRAEREESTRMTQSTLIIKKVSEVFMLKR